MLDPLPERRHLVRTARIASIPFTRPGRKRGEKLKMKRIVGWLLAFDLAIYSFIAFLPLTFVVLVPSLVLLPLWFVLVGRLLSRKREYQQAHNDVTELR